jgi:hypothetical protein
VIDEFHPSFGSHPSMMEGFVMCSLKKSINNEFFICIQLVVFGTTTVFLSLLRRAVIQP